MRWAVRRHGRTSFEHAKGHKTKTPVACFGEQLLWRKRKTGALNKLDADWTEGIFLGMTGQTSEISIGTEDGVFTTSDVRRLPDGPGRWNVKMIENMKTTFEEYIDPSQVSPDAIAVHVPDAVADPSIVPENPAVPQGSRRMRLGPEDFERHGYTGGCQGFIHLRRKSPTRRNHSEACRKRVEAEIQKTSEGRARKERESQRKEDELTRELEKEDERIRAEAEVIGKSKVEGSAPRSAENEVVELDSRRVHPSTPIREADKEGDDWMGEEDAKDDDIRQGDIAMGSAEFHQMQTPVHSPAKMFTPHSPNAFEGADKRFKITTEARREVEDRPGGTARKAPASPVPADNKKARVGSESDDMQVLSALLRGVDVTEVFSPERVVRVCAKYNLTPGDSFDLRTGFDLSDKKVQKDVIHKMYGDGRCPGLVIGSPPCTHFSQLVSLNLHVQGPEWAEKHAI